MTPSQIEMIYEALATRLDAIGETKHDLYLAKLVLLLARDMGDVDAVLQRMEEASCNLDS